VDYGSNNNIALICPNLNITLFLFNNVRAYFSRFRCHVEILRLNIFLACDLRAQFARILIRRLLPCCRARRIWARESRLARKSCGHSRIPRIRREIRPYIHWQLTSTSSRIMEISTRVVGEIGCQEIIFRMFSYKRLDVVHLEWWISRAKRVLSLWLL